MLPVGFDHSKLNPLIPQCTETQYTKIYKLHAALEVTLKVISREIWLKLTLLKGLPFRVRLAKFLAKSAPSPSCENPLRDTIVGILLALILNYLHVYG
jgi:hypothetical protein